MRGISIVGGNIVLCRLSLSQSPLAISVFIICHRRAPPVAMKEVCNPTVDGGPSTSIADADPDWSEIVLLQFFSRWLSETDPYRKP